MTQQVEATASGDGYRRYVFPTHLSSAQIERVRQEIRRIDNVIAASSSARNGNWIQVSARENGPAVLDPQVETAIRTALGSNDYRVIAR